MTTFQMAPRIDDVADLATRVVRALGVGFERPPVHAAITEALLNAVLYGVLGIEPSHEREPHAFLASVRAAESRAHSQARIEVEIEEPAADERVVLVRDQGSGFRWRATTDAPRPDAPRGRGLLIIRAGTASVTWSERGDEIALRFRRDPRPVRRRALGDAGADRIASQGGDRLARSRRVLLRAVSLAWRRARRTIGSAARRAIDIVGGGAALIATAPIILVAAAAVKLESPGGAFVRQVRVGRNGELFVLYKIRSMCAEAHVKRAALEHVNESGGHTFKMRRDPRVTRAGRWLRKTSVDELPQLWNLVNGTMTLLGPRAALPDEVARYDARARRRLEVKPGLTGLWQVSGRSDLPFGRQIDLDLTFIDTSDVRKEALIVARTFPAVVTGKGAY